MINNDANKPFRYFHLILYTDIDIQFTVRTSGYISTPYTLSAAKKLSAARARDHSLGRRIFATSGVISAGERGVRDAGAEGVDGGERER